MHFAFTDEQEQFRAAIRRFLRERAPTAEVRRIMVTAEGYDPAVWAALHADLGLIGLQVPERFGGQGFGFVELGIAQEEFGRALLCAPYFSSCVLATQALLNVATETKQQALLPDIASGRRRATLAWMARSDDWDPAATGVTADSAGVLNGRARYVLDGRHAELVLVVARHAAGAGDDGLGLYAVDAPAPGLERRALATIDETRKLADLEFVNVSARRLDSPGTAAAALRRTLHEAAIALACEMVGGARALLESAVDYAKLRMQFGRPIGSFQAIKHKCAELLLEVELAGASTCYAAAAVAAGDPDVPQLAALAKAVAADAYLHVAVESIQIHGGIGFTWDNDTHLWYKRAKSSEVMLGDPSQHREAYVRAIEEGA